MSAIPDFGTRIAPAESAKSMAALFPVITMLAVPPSVGSKVAELLSLSKIAQSGG
jgi:hypothetical protein